jgi:hypothetical protein
LICFRGCSLFQYLELAFARKTVMSTGLTEIGSAQADNNVLEVDAQLRSALGSGTFPADRIK